MKTKSMVTVAVVMLWGATTFAQSVNYDFRLTTGGADDKSLTAFSTITVVGDEPSQVYFVKGRAGCPITQDTTVEAWDAIAVPNGSGVSLATKWLAVKNAVTPWHRVRNITSDTKKCCYKNEGNNTLGDPGIFGCINADFSMWKFEGLID